MSVLTREQMTERYGSVPPFIPSGKPYRWTLNMAHASVTWETLDGGNTWMRAGAPISATERQRRDEETEELYRTMRELKW